MNNFNKLLSILHKWKSYYLLSAALLVVSIFVRMLEPKILQIAIDGVIVFFKSGAVGQPVSNDSVARQIYKLLPEFTPENLSRILIGIALLYVSIAVVRGFTHFGSSAIAAYCTEKSVKRLRDRLFAHLQLLPINYHNQNKTGDIIQRCTGDVDTVKGFINSQIVDMVLLSSIFISAFVMMISVHVTYAFITITMVPIIIGTAILFFKKERKVWDLHEAEQDKLTSIVEENLAGIRVVKAFAKEDYEREKFDFQNNAKFEIGKKHLRLHAWFWPFSDLMVWTQLAISVCAGGYFALMQQITVGELISFYSYAFMVTMPMRRLGRVVSQTGMAMVAIERLSAILDAEKENYEGFSRKEGIIGNIEFRNVSFKYSPDEDEEFALKNVSFKVNAGQTVAMLGPTGAGKSTIIRLLVRFYEPTKGEIFLDGKPLHTYSKRFLRKNLGVVLQKSFLFSTTIGQNIAYAAPNAKHDAVVEAATAASIHEIMDIFPEGYDTLVGEKGVTLSGGQKQRVALARTLLEEPDLLILDDTTSAVDTQTEQYIQNALENHTHNKTTFIIAHRVSSFKNADLILVFDNGELIEEGTHNELMQTNGFYKKVYELQGAES